MHATRQLLPILALLAALAAGCSSDESDPRPAGAPDAPEETVIAGTTGRYVGSATCEPCHEEIHAAWVESRHRATLRPWSTDTPSALVGKELPGGFTLGADGVVTGPGQEGETVRAEAAFLVGGRRREDLWVRTEDGRLQVFPISFDPDSGQVFHPLAEMKRGVPPPPDSVDHWTRFGRNADSTCYGCHATGSILMQTERSTPFGNPVAVSRWAEPGVGCEACHGPGGRHVAAAREGRPEDAPPNAGADTAADIEVARCASCHGLGTLLHSPFRTSPARSGDAPAWESILPLVAGGTNAEFRTPLFPDLRPATYQQEAIALGQSGCVRRGDLTCAKCHDVHSGTLTIDSEASTACLPCHQAVVDDLAGHSRHEPGTPGGRCLDCHMAPILRGPATVRARDHSLAPPIAGPDEIPVACTNCHGDRSGYAGLLEAWNAFPHDSASSRRRLRLARATDPGTPRAEAVAALASFLEDPEESWFLRSAAAMYLLRLPPAGPDPVAASAARRAVGADNPLVRRLAVTVLGQNGEEADIQTLDRLANEPDPFLALAATRATGALGSAYASVRLASLTTRPELAEEFRAHVAAAGAAMADRDWRGAELALSRALELNPLLVNALNDLGIALYMQERAPLARVYWRRALELNPQFNAARRNLAEKAPEQDDPS